MKAAITNEAQGESKMNYYPNDHDDEQFKLVKFKNVSTAISYQKFSH